MTILPRPIMNYRDRIITASFVTRLVVGGGVVMVLFVLGFGQATLAGALPAVWVSVVYLLVLLALAYTFYALLRSFVYSSQHK